MRVYEKETCSKLISSVIDKVGTRKLFLSR